MPAVLHLLNSFTGGGTERQAIQLANAQHDAGEWAVTVAVLDAQGPLRHELAPALHERCAAFPLRRFASISTLRQLYALATFMRQHDIRIVHTHGFYPNVLGMHASAFARVPVRIASKRESVALRSVARQRLERVAFGLATHVLTNCEAVRDELLNAGLRSPKVTVVPNALHPERVREASAEADAPSDAPRRRIVMVGNFHHAAKDHATLLTAARRVVAHAADVEFLLVGDGPGRASAEALAGDLQLGQHVRFLGYCADVADVLRGAAIGVLSSRLEGMPNAILEYMAAGLPVVATDTGGVRELVDDGRTGRLVQPGDALTMAAAILELLDDPARRATMGSAGRARALRDFSLDAQRSRISALYAEELARAAATRR